MGPGDRVTWRAKHFGVWHCLTSEITAMRRPAYFQDTMTQGIFRFMNHEHHFQALSHFQARSEGGETEMRDVLRFAAPLPVLGRAAEVLVLRRYMKALLCERNFVLREIAESEAWRRYLP